MFIFKEQHNTKNILVFSKLEIIADNLLRGAFYNRIAFENSISEVDPYEFGDEITECEKSAERRTRPFCESTEYNPRQAIFYTETMKLTHLFAYEIAKTQLNIVDGKD